MIVENQNNTIDIYIQINNCWCHSHHLPNKNNCKILENIVKNYEQPK